MQIASRSVTAVAALAAGASLVAAAPSAASAAPTVKSSITVRASDHTVDPGEQFILRGRMTTAKRVLPGATVRVQAFRNGGWHNLSGAVVRTNDEGRYRVRVILSSGGDRDLRVVGDPRGDRIKKSRAYTVVRVLG